jgi:hypothetical protein
MATSALALSSPQPSAPNRAPAEGAPEIELHSTYAEKTRAIATPGFGCDCPAGHFCAWGTKSSHHAVEVRIGDQVVAVDGDPSDDDEGVDPFPDPAAKLCHVQYPLWFASVPSLEVPAGSVVTASFVDRPTVVLHRGRHDRTSEFDVDGTFTYRGDPTNGSIGAGIGIASMARGLKEPNAADGPLAESSSRWTFGARYDAALFSQDWLHRLTVLADYDLCRHPTWRFTPGLALGGAVSAQTSGGSAIHAGFLAGFSLQFEVRVAGPVAAAFGFLGQGIFANTSTTLLGTGYAGPKVTF